MWQYAGWITRAKDLFVEWDFKKMPEKKEWLNIQTEISWW